MRVLRKLDKLRKYNLHTSDADFGKLEQIYFDDRHWQIHYFVVRTGSWLLGRVTLILPRSVAAVDDTSKHIDLALTREQVEHSPPYNTKLPVSRHYEQQYFQYYGYEPYWVGDPLYGSAPQNPVNTEGLLSEPENSHLRSSQEVRGYTLHARDGTIGQVEDFIVGDPDWALAYLEVDTRKWLPGKHVLVAPAWINQVVWEKREVVVDLSRDTIVSAPAYGPDKVISRDYQVTLYQHYGMNYEEN